MARYQIVFSEKGEKGQLRDEFTADSDTAAILVADWLFDACSDIFESYELWSGSRHFIPLSQMGITGISLAVRTHAGTSRNVQEIVADRERVMMDSHRAIARSRRLLQESRKLSALLEPRTVSQ